VRVRALTLQQQFYSLRGVAAVDDWLDLRAAINIAIREMRVRAQELEASDEAARDSPRRVAVWATIGDAHWIVGELNALALNVEHELARLRSFKSTPSTDR